MWWLIDADAICFYIFFTIFFGLAAVFFRYYKEGDVIFCDSSTYFLLLTYLYVAVPAYVQLNTNKTLINASSEDILFSSRYSLYFIVILSLYFISRLKYSSLKDINQPTVSIKPIKMVPIKNNVLYALYVAISVYVLIVFFTNSPGIIYLWSNRGAASELKTTLNDTYKIAFLFSVTVSIIAYLVIKNKKKLYLLMFVPYVLMDLITTDRDFLYQSLIVSIGALVLTRTKIPIIKLTLGAFFIVSIEVLRVNWNSDFGLDFLLFVPGELLLTAEAGLIIIQSHNSINVIALIIYSFGKLFTPQVMNVFFANIPHFGQIVSAESPLITGLGGSILSEVYSLKNTLALLIYPFIAILYLETINIIKRRCGFIGILIFLFYLTSTQPIFRKGLIFTMIEPIYYSIYAAAWYWIIRAIYANKCKIFTL